MRLVPVTLEDDTTYRLTVWYGKNQSMSIDKGQMYRPVRDTLTDILVRNMFYGLYMEDAK